MLAYKKSKSQRKPATMFARVDLRKRDPRRVYRTIRRALGGMRYRSDLREVSVTVNVMMYSFYCSLSVLYMYSWLFVELVY